MPIHSRAGSEDMPPQQDPSDRKDRAEDYGRRRDQQRSKKIAVKPHRPIDQIARPEGD